MSNTPDSNAILAEFNLLMEEFLAGNLKRSRFRPWEIDVLLDIESCDLHGSVLTRVVREYQHAVQAQLEEASDRPMKLSEYLEQIRLRRPRRKLAAGALASSAKPKTRAHSFCDRLKRFD